MISSPVDELLLQNPGCSLRLGLYLIKCMIWSSLNNAANLPPWLRMEVNASKFSVVNDVAQS